MRSCFPDIAGWSGYPSIAAMLGNPGIDVMGQQTMLPDDARVYFGSPNGS
jgi:hypothetical protein